MAETEHTASNNHENTQDIKGELTYEDKVVQKIVGLALETVDGLLAVEGGFFSNLTGKLVNTDDVTSGVDVEVGKTQVAVDLKVITEYRKNVPEIYNQIKDVIRKEVANMTDLDVVEVNVTVTDIKTKEQQKDDEVTVQDRVVDAAQTTGKLTSKQVDKVKDKVDDMTPENGRVE
ncbi:Asp23/Gls24 family envelope stress response protein [Lactococcus formosensis]|uniref:Asp23/Gls24 family envelope stress response protein n=1 Tax=Lactococcus formosensis TaxID=1281486 RepID=UPI002435AC58|nr:Asp23/Gls24 family envelope stress response protein [Lactococcus formosensis]MDG6120051.1 Asp23/Gls24 family envelope stress response protein [Lactococcus formosensis]